MKIETYIDSFVSYAMNTGLTELKEKYTFTAENTLNIILQETGEAFAAVLEDTGVYKNTCEGRTAFLHFVDYVNQA